MALGKGVKGQIEGLFYGHKIFSSRCARWLRVLNAGLSLSGGCGELGVSGRGFLGVCVGGKTGGDVAARCVDRQMGVKTILWWSRRVADMVCLD